MSRYAKATVVPVSRSREQVMTLLEKYGAVRVAYASDTRSALVTFEKEHRLIRMRIPLPCISDASTGADRQRHAQVLRSRWRAILLVIKAKLEAVETGITTFEEEFMAFIAMPDGRTVGQIAAKQIEEAYASGKSTVMLLGAGD